MMNTGWTNKRHMLRDIIQHLILDDELQSRKRPLCPRPVGELLVRGAHHSDDQVEEHEERED